MPYIATSLICGPRYTCLEGKEAIGCPSDLLAQYLNCGLLKAVGPAGPAEALIADQDVLTPLTQAQLITVIKKNNLKDLVKPMSNWSDEQIRQGIRDVFPDVDQLELPNVQADS